MMHLCMQALQQVVGEPSRKRSRSSSEPRLANFEILQSAGSTIPPKPQQQWAIANHAWGPEYKRMRTMPFDGDSLASEDASEVILEEGANDLQANGFRMHPGAGHVEPQGREDPSTDAGASSRRVLQVQPKPIQRQLIDASKGPPARKMGACEMMNHCETPVMSERRPAEPKAKKRAMPTGPTTRAKAEATKNGSAKTRTDACTRTNGRGNAKGNISPPPWH